MFDEHFVGSDVSSPSVQHAPLSANSNLDGQLSKGKGRIDCGEYEFGLSDQVMRDAYLQAFPIQHVGHCTSGSDKLSATNN